jgi:hypothetical protein
VNASIHLGNPIVVARLLPQHKTMRFWGVTVGWFGIGVMWFSHVTEEEFALANPLGGESEGDVNG